MHSKQRPERYTHDPGGWARHLGNRTWQWKTHYLQGSCLLKKATSRCDQVTATTHQIIFQKCLKARGLLIGFYLTYTMFIDFMFSVRSSSVQSPNVVQWIMIITRGAYEQKRTIAVIQHVGKNGTVISQGTYTQSLCLIRPQKYIVSLVEIPLFTDDSFLRHVDSPVA